MPEIVRNIFRGLSIAGGIAFVIIGIMLIREWISGKHKRPAEEKKKNLADILTSMHRRLIELQGKKAKSTKIGFRELDRVLPTLANRIGIVKYENRAKFEKDIRRRIQHAMPRRNFLHPLSFVEYRKQVDFAKLSVALQVKKELFESKKWTFEDAKEISNWIDDHHFGVRVLRDNDSEWGTLSQSLDPYRTDQKLRELMQKHIEVSLFYNNVCLIICYSERYPKTSFSSMLHEELVGSPISPEEIDMALGEILQEIESYPGFTVEPKVLNRGAIVEVTNNGQTATFRAIGRIHRDIQHEPQFFPLYWEAYGEHVELGNGDTRHILVARQESWGISAQPIGGLNIHKAMPSSPEGYEVFYAGAWHTPSSSPVADPVYLEVVISPIPPSKREYRAYYVLEQPTISKLVFRKVDSLPSDSQN